MLLAQLSLSPATPHDPVSQHMLVLLPKEKKLPRNLPQDALLKAVLARRGLKPDELASTPVSANTPSGGLITWAMLDFTREIFSLQTQVRKALQLLGKWLAFAGSQEKKRSKTTPEH